MTKEELKQLENDLWSSADTLRANSALKSNEYATPVLGLIFLKFADNKYRLHEEAIRAEYEEHLGKRTEKELSEIAIARCGFFLPDHARYDYLLNLSGDQEIAKAIKQAMMAIEQYKPELAGVLPQDAYYKLAPGNDGSILGRLLKNFANIPDDADGDMFGQIYEYFLGNFALAEGQGGGEFFTPRSVVQLMVEIIEPHSGRVFDPACGSGGMFVQSAKFIAQHRKELAEDEESAVVVYGQEKTRETVNLAKMNLAVNGLRGQVLQTNSYYTDPFTSFGFFDYVLANPPFNVDDVSVSNIEKDPRFNTYGIPRNKTKAKDQGKETVPNGNYLWISLFATSLNATGRAALVMANSASDARHSEAEIRRKLIEDNLIYGMLSLPSNMFYTVTLPATLWLFDKGKQDDTILFIDARNIFTPIDRAHREFSEEQVQNIAVISHLHKGKRARFIELIDGYFRQGMAKLQENMKQVVPVSAQLRDVLDDDAGKQAVDDLVKQWAGLAALETAFNGYDVGAQHAAPKLYSPALLAPASDLPGSDIRAQHAAPLRENIELINTAQHQLRASFDPFFVALHEGLKKLDKIVRHHEKVLSDKAKADGKRGSTDKKTKALKSALEVLHEEVKTAENYYRHITWLQDRFPHATYEDVIGLCKAATPDEVKEQDYSLNPGRYVGVVIEEDGKTEEEFLSDLAQWQDLLDQLTLEASEVGNIIATNIKTILADCE